MDQLRQHSPSMLISHPTNQASLSFYEKNLTAAPLPLFKEGQGGGKGGQSALFIEVSMTSAFYYYLRDSYEIPTIVPYS